MGKQEKNKGGPSQNGRTRKGTFAKGNKCSVGNKGNTMHTKAKELHKALYEAVGKEDLAQIVDKMIEQAKAGDKDARKECFDRLWGKAKQSIDHGTSGQLPPIRIEIVKDDTKHNS